MSTQNLLGAKAGNLPRVNRHQWNGNAGEKDGDEEEKLPSPNIRQRSYQWRTEERQNAFNAHHQPIHQERMVREGFVEDIDDGHR